MVNTTLGPATRAGGIPPGLADVPETMLWALHNRATEAKRHDGILVDPASVRIHDAIDYDFTRRFGDPAGSLAVRAAAIDRTLRRWLERHPDGTVVSLGEGLETQRHRVDNRRMRWLTVDLPEAIRLRERFLAPTDRFRHIAGCALDPAWMDAVDPSSGVFIVAQGLLMYLEPDRVRRLFTGIADRFPGTEMVFDAVPRWFSHLTLAGLNQTPHYRLPRMPWGIDRDDVESTLRHWHPRVADVAFLDYRVPRGLPRLLAEIASHFPAARHRVPSLVHVTIANIDGALAAPCRLLEAPGIQPGTFTTTRRPRMTSFDGTTALADKVGGMMALATQNASGGGDIARAATHVIAKRVALGMAAAFDPLRADHAEFGRMVPEKIEAFSTAGMVMLKQAGQAHLHMMRLATADAMTTADATLRMTGCASPASLARAGDTFIRAWFQRAASRFITMGMLTLDTQAAAMAPIRRAVVDNAARLSG